MNKWLIGLLVLAVLALLGYWYMNRTQAPQASDETIRIGAVLGLTGSAATDSLNIQRGLDLAKEDLAAKGVTVDISYQDDKTDPKGTVSALQYLFSTYKPDAIVGPAWSFLQSAAGPSIAAAKIVAYAPANTSEFVEGVTSYQFQGAPRNALKEEPVAAWLKEHGKTRVAIIVDKSAWGESNAKPFRAAAAKAGAEVVLDETFQPFASDIGNIMQSHLTKAKAANADVIIWTGYDPDAVALAQKRHSLEITAPVLAASQVYRGLLSRNVLTKEALKDFYEIVPPSSTEFAEKFRAKYGEMPGNYSERAYDGLMILVTALQNAPAKDGDSVATYIREKLRYEGYAGLYEFNENGDVVGGKWLIRQIVGE